MLLCHDLLFWGWRVDSHSIFCDVRCEHDPANGCLVTDLLRITTDQMKNLLDRCRLSLWCASCEVPGISYPRLTITYHGGRGFHERAAPCQQKCLGRVVRECGLPTSGRRLGPSLAFPFMERFCFSPADSPCFHSHSFVERQLRCQLGSSISNRVLPSQHRTERLRFRKRSFRRDLAVTRTRRWVTELHWLQAACCEGAAWLWRNGS